MTARDRAIRLVWVLVAIGAISSIAADPETLDNESVVRMLEAGRRPESVIEAIRRGRAAFDLAPESVEELIRAGVPASVIDAMRERQAPPADRTAAQPATRTRVRVEIGYSGDGAKPKALTLPRAVDARAAAALGLPQAAPETRAEDFAIFFACTRSEHVPDGWKAASPLGRDFPHMPRHEMLQFRSAGGSASPATSTEVTFGDLSPLEGEVTSGAEHDWLVGITASIDGRWRLLAAGTLRDQRVDDPPGSWKVTLKIPAPQSLAIEIRITASAIRASTPPPPPS